ncbi:MAG: nickel pincer cofactor biosynthesis protein LarB [Planctomycetota bacterium]
MCSSDLGKIAAGKISAEDGVSGIKNLFTSNLGYARVDHHRSLRCGFPEVIYCPGKSSEQIEGIAANILERGDTMLATRTFPDAVERLLARFPDAVHNEAARTVSVSRGKKQRKKGLVAIVTAGTSDIPVAEEARVTADLMGARTQALYDVGVAGIHRLLEHVDLLKKARSVVVVAGMEGALASVVGGLVDRPVIAVPTSVGYGASLNGIAALLSMLNSCASNVSVVNIDNGFSAGTIAALINR